MPGLEIVDCLSAGGAARDLKTATVRHLMEIVMVDRLAFDSRYSVGIEQVDNEHRKLFDLADRIYDVLSMDVIMPMDHIKAAVIELVDCTKLHFANEEQLMETNGYAGLAKHQEQHASLIDRINDFAKRVVRGEQVTPVDAYEFLCEWLVDHIQTFDREFGEFLSQRVDSAQ
jgi:hemerythrin-like metal-binding protein